MKHHIPIVPTAPPPPGAGDLAPHAWDAVVSGLKFTLMLPAVLLVTGTAFGAYVAYGQREWPFLLLGVMFAVLMLAASVGGTALVLGGFLALNALLRAWHGAVEAWQAWFASRGWSGGDVWDRESDGY